MNDSRYNLSIVIPVYKSEAIILELHQRLTTVLRSITHQYEIIFVNDCSPDNVWQKIKDLAESDTHIKALLLRKNVGYDNLKVARKIFHDSPSPLF